MKTLLVTAALLLATSSYSGQKAITDTGEQVAMGGDDFGAAGAPPASDAARAPTAKPQAPGAAGHFADLDFLAETSAILVNLTPDKDGEVEIKLDALGGHQHLHVVAVDPLNTTYRTASLPEKAPVILDLRLAAALEPYDPQLSAALAAIALVVWEARGEPRLHHRGAQA